MKTLNTTCYTIQDGEIVEGTLADFSCFIESTTRPTGVGYTYYVTTVTRDVEHDTDQVDEDGYVITETFEDDVWVLAKWASWSGPQVVIREFPSEKLANTAAEAIYVYDICHNRELEIYFHKEHAQCDLNQTQEV